MNLFKGKLKTAFEKHLSPIAGIELSYDLS